MNYLGIIIIYQTWSKFPQDKNNFCFWFSLLNWPWNLLQRTSFEDNYFFVSDFYVHEHGVHEYGSLSVVDKFIR